jgi:transcriptional regulator of arginine metabolism
MGRTGVQYELPVTCYLSLVTCYLLPVSCHQPHSVKLQRHSAILRIVRSQRIPTQDVLRQALDGEGIAIAQATLSRDIHELGLVKQSDPAGGAFYVVPVESPVRPDLAGTLRNWVLSLDGVGPLLVLRTASGGAGPVAATVDQAGWSELLGAVVGADTVLLVSRSEQARKILERRIEGLRQR